MKTLSIDHFEFYSAADLISDAISTAIKPDEKLTVSEWADRNRMLTSDTSPEPGLWNTKRTPFLREIQDELSPHSPTITITFVKGSQVGGTECGLNWIGTTIDKYPCPMLMVTPSHSMLKKNSRTRIQPMLENTPCLSGKVKSKNSKEAGNSVDLKEFQGGLLALSTAGSASGLRSQPIKYLFLDEMSAYQADVDDEGDPVELAKARTNNFGRKKKIFQVSTPLVRGSCRIEREFEKSDKRYYNIPCIHCGHKFHIHWDLIKYKKDENNTLIIESVHLECPKCNGEIPEHKKTWFLAEENGAEWVPTAVGESLHKGYHLSSLYSPLGWNSWVEIIEKWLTATHEAKKGNFTALKTFKNTQLGETWEDPASKMNNALLWEQREEWPSTYDVPLGGLFLTIGCDVQGDRLEAAVYAWGEQEECWGITYKVFYGNTSDINDPCWTQLESLIYKDKFRHESGCVLGVSTACVDSGYLADVVYQFVLRNKQRGLYAIKGEGRENYPIVKRSKQNRHGRSKTLINLFHVGTFEAKRSLSLRTQATKENINLHYPISECFDEEFFNQLASEQMITTYVKGFAKRHFMLPAGHRNESLDTWVYSFAALRIGDPSFAVLKKQLGIKDTDGDELETEEIAPTYQEQLQAERRKAFQRPKQSKLHKGRG